MDILAVQQRLIDKGYQFIEHIYNDGMIRNGVLVNCIIAITKNQVRGFTLENHFTWGGVSWGRFGRHEAWAYVAEWLDKQELGA